MAVFADVHVVFGDAVVAKSGFPGTCIFISVLPAIELDCVIANSKVDLSDEDVVSTSNHR